MHTSAVSRELWFTGPRAVALRAAAVPTVAPGQVLAQAIASGISQGTELLLYRGEGPTPFDPSLCPSGAPTYPRRYGYAWVGKVVERGAGVVRPEVGAVVFALAPHGDWSVLGAADARTLGDGIPPARAVLAANLETAVNCVWDAGISIGDEVVVIGGGIVGLLITWLARAAGGRVRLVEPGARRRAVAEFLGACKTAPPESDDPRGDADVVIEASGDPAALDRAIAHAAPEATVLVASFYGARTAPVALGDAFHRRRLALRASQVSAVPPARAPRWTLARRFGLVRSLLADAHLDALLDRPIDFDAAPSVYARLDAAPGDALQTIFSYG